MSTSSISKAAAARNPGSRCEAVGGYGLNTKGQPHSAMIATETISLIIYTGEPDEVRSMEVVDIAS